MESIESIRDVWEGKRSEYSDEAQGIVDSVLDRVTEGEEAEDAVNDEMDGALIYYSDAFDYLTDNSITDFSEAISEDFTDVIGIATFYLDEEVRGALEEIGLE